MDYSIFVNDLVSTTTIVLLLMTILSTWLRNYRLTGVFFTGYFVCGLLSGRIEWYLVSIFTSLLIALAIFKNKTHKMYRILGFLVFFTLPILLLLNAIPGVNDWEIVSKYPFGIDSIPYSIYLNFASPVVGLVGLLVIRKKLIASIGELKNTLKVSIPTWIILLCVLMPLSYLLGYVRFDFKTTTIFYAWAMSNLFFTCITEEVFFRLFLQDTFVEMASKYTKWSVPIGIGIASALFGIAHFAGGPKYVLLACIAGIFYGYAYYKTSRIEASILTHFLLNATHFIFFSYPALQSAIPLK